MNITSIGTTQSIYAAQRNTVNTSNSVKITEADLKNIYAQTVSESSGKSARGLENEAFYSEPAAKAVSSEEYIAEQKERFSDMYLTSAAHEYFSANKSKIISDTSGFGLSNVLVELLRTAGKEGCIPVPIEAGELPQFMDTIQNALSKGMALEDIFKQKVDDYIQRHKTPSVYGNDYADILCVKPSTGEVMAAIPFSRTYSGDALDEELSDVEAVMELADDLTTFLRYALMDEEDHEKIEELFSFLKNKQAYADYYRFFADGDGGAADKIMERLIAAGVLDNDDEEEAVDGLMEAIRIHQEELRNNKIDLEESRKAISEIKEIIDKQKVSNGNKNT